MTMLSKNFSIRTLVLLLGFALIISAVAPMLVRAFAADGDVVQVQLTFAQAGPRKLEDSTQTSISRNYANAWKNLAEALNDNRTDRLDQSFVGAARDILEEQVTAQQKSGMATRYIDHGHKLNAVFYSPEGSAMQLQDTAQMEIQILDGGKVIHSEQVTQHYHVLMTVAEDRWKVRALQAIP
jgi:hypothetical protein